MAPKAEKGKRKRTAFISNPFTFFKKFLGDECSDSLVCSADELNTFLHNALSDPERELELQPQRALIIPPPLSVEFTLREPTWTEIKEVVSSSSVPYIVYKHCPQLVRCLWKKVI